MVVVRERNLKRNGCPGPGRGIDLATASQMFESIAEIQKPVAVRAAGQVEAAAVVADRDYYPVIDQAHPKVYLGRAAVTDRIIQGFLHRKKKLMAHFAGNLVFRKGIGYLHAAGEAQ